MNEKNKKFSNDVPDEVLEQIAAEKRRKLEEFLKGLEQQEAAHRGTESGGTTIHSDLFAGERFTPKPEETPPADEWDGDEDVKIFGQPETAAPTPDVPAPEAGEPSAAADAPEQAEEDGEPETLSLFEQDHIIREEVSEAKRLEEEKRRQDETRVMPDGASEEPEADPVRPSTQEILKQARYEKIKSFALDQNLDLESQSVPGDREDEEEDEEDANVYEYLPDSDPAKIRGDFSVWKRRRLLQIWVSGICFVLMLLIVLSPVLPFKLLPYSFAAPSETSSPASTMTSSEALPVNEAVVSGTLMADPGAAQPDSAQTDEKTGLADTVNPKPTEVRILVVILVGLNLVTAVFCFDTLRDGAVDFFRMGATYQSGAFVVFLVCMVQAVFLAARPEGSSFAAGVTGVFMPASALSVFLAELATYLRLLRDENNFAAVSAGRARHLRVQNIGDSNVLERPRGDADCATAVFVPADFSSDFFAMADCEDGCDRTERVFVPCVLLAGLLAGLIAFLMNGRSAAYFITVLTGFVCTVTPLSMGIFTVIGQLRAARVGRETGFAVSNQFAYEDATEMTSVVVSDTEIFSAKSMVLHGIKTFNEKRMDEAIVIAASVCQKRGGPLRELFSAILSENEAYLLEVDNETVYQPEKGMVCWIAGKRVVMGTRDFVGGYDIELPDAEYERKYARNGRSLVYLALGNEMMAIFVVSYRAIPEIGAMLRAISACGVTVLVNTNDPCLTSRMLCRALKLPAGSVLVLNAQGKDVYENLTQPVASLKSGVVCTGGTAAELTAAVSCFRLRRSYAAGMGLQYALMILSAAIFMIQAVFGNFDALTIGLTLAMQLIGMGLLCLLQFLFRYRIRRRKAK